MSINTIAVVSGLPRSGTSLMMQMLESGGIPALTDGQRVADEDNPRGYLELEAVKRTRQDPAWLAQASGRVVKMVHLLLYDLPLDHHYKVVFMHRDLQEVVASQRKMLERQNKPRAALTDEQLMRVFSDQVEKLRQWLSQHPAFDVMDVSYNSLISDARPIAARLNSFFGGGLDESRMLSAVEPSLYRNRALKP
jgi:hypothetical protein